MVLIVDGFMSQVSALQFEYGLLIASSLFSNIAMVSKYQAWSACCVDQIVQSNVLQMGVAAHP